MRRKQAEVRVRPMLASPEPGSLPFIDLSSAIDIEYEASHFLPDLSSDLGFSPEEVKSTAEQDDRICFRFKGGEEAGLKRLQDYLFDKGKLSTYQITRNELMGADSSSKLSPWLANGSLSIKKVYWEVRKFE